jgi:hypothetical protein
VTKKYALLERANDYVFTFSTGEGKRVLEDLRAAYGDRLSYVKGDPFETSRKEGQREVYLHILHQIKLATDRKYRESVSANPKTTEADNSEQEED